MTDRYVRPEERLARELRKQRAGLRDVQRPTGTEKNLTTEVALAADSKAETALGDAADAAEDAANALETALGNARYRYDPVEDSYDPELPEDGPGVGAERIWLDEESRPFRVDVWNGTQWNRSQLLADQFLAIGEDGNVLIENGRMVASEIFGTDIHGATLHGGTYYGGEFIQYASDDMTVIYPEGPGVLVPEDWSGGAPQSWEHAGTSTTVTETGDYSVMVKRLNPGSLSAVWENDNRTPLLSTTPRGVAIKVYCSSPMTGVHVTTPDGSQEFDDIPADEWVWLNVDLEDDVSLEWVHVGGVVSDLASFLYVDEFRIVATQLDGAHMQISRDARGLPGVFIYNSEGELLGAMTPDGIVTNRLTVEEAGTSVELTATSGGLAPTGMVSPFAGDTSPDGWLLCDGQEVSRSEFDRLFEVIGTRYGAGDGVETFALPNLSGRVPVGLNSGTFTPLGKTGGAETHTLTQSQMPSHSHGVSGTDGTNRFVTTDRAGNFSPRAAPETTTGTAVPGYSGGESVGTAGSTDNAGSGSAHNNLQPYVVMNYIIKA